MPEDKKFTPPRRLQEFTTFDTDIRECDIQGNSASDCEPCTGGTWPVTYKVDGKETDFSGDDPLPTLSVAFDFVSSRLKVRAHGGDDAQIVGTELQSTKLLSLEAGDYDTVETLSHSLEKGKQRYQHVFRVERLPDEEHCTSAPSPQ